MTIKTKMLKPIKELNVDELYNLKTTYAEIDSFLNQPRIWNLQLSILDVDDDPIETITLDYKIVGGIMAALQELRDTAENKLNIRGYTMQDDPKEWQYHVNVLECEGDDN